MDEVTTSHTMTIFREIKIDVWKLIAKSKKKPVTRKRLSSLRHCGFSHQSGFCWNRYYGTDTSYPILIAWDNFVLDGRHRLLKLKKQGRKTAKVIVMTNAEVDECRIK